MCRGPTKTDRRTLSFATGDYVAGWSEGYENQGLDQPRFQALSSLPPLVVAGRKTLVATGHVITCETNFSTGVVSTNNFCRSYSKLRTQVKRNIFTYIRRIEDD